MTLRKQIEWAGFVFKFPKYHSHYAEANGGLDFFRYDVELSIFEVWITLLKYGPEALHWKSAKYKFKMAWDKEPYRVKGLSDLK